MHYFFSHVCIKTIMQTILLTGASGAVGYQTLKELLKYKKRFRIKVFEIKTRTTNKKLSLFKNEVEIFWGDISKSEDVEKAVKNSDIIIHTAALIPPMADKHHKLAEKVNFIGTQNIVNSINILNSNIFLIYTSSISVYGDRVNTPNIQVSDKIKPSPKDFYAITKMKAEKYIKINMRNYTILRLSAVMHPKIKLDPLFFHMPLNTSLEIVTTKDVGYALVKSITKKEFLNERIFNLGGGKLCRISYKDFLKENYKIFGLGKLNFPKYAFAEKNFHCGFYEDSDILNSILNFQRESLYDYFNEVENSRSFLKRKIIGIFKGIIQKELLRKSEPYQAFINKNSEMINHFFNKK